jgi:hypothetical protein
MTREKVRWKGVNTKSKDSAGGIERAFNITVEKEDFLDPDYTLNIYPSESRTTDQGLLLVGSLEPRLGGFPRFSLRWDEKGQHLNVDIHGVSKAKRRAFINGTDGYSGHVCNKVKNSGRLFDVDIHIPNRPIFKGIIRFNLAYNEQCIVRIGCTVSANATVSK